MAEMATGLIVVGLSVAIGVRGLAGNAIDFLLLLAFSVWCIALGASL